MEQIGERMRQQQQKKKKQNETARNPDYSNGYFCVDSLQLGIFFN